MDDQKDAHASHDQVMYVIDGVVAPASATRNSPPGPEVPGLEKKHKVRLKGK